MSQTTALTFGANPNDMAPMSTTPKVGYILKRYRWVIVTITALGLIIGAMLYLAFHKWDPRWTATEYFQVKPIQSSPLQSRQIGSAAPDSTEILRFINRQVQLILSPQVLHAAIDQVEFQRNYQDPNNPNLKSTWLEAHSVHPASALAKALSVGPVPHSGLFTISLSWHDKNEAAQLVTAVGRVYQATLREQEKQELQNNARAVSQAQAKMQQQVDDLQQSLEAYRRSHDIPGLIEQHSVIASTLAQLNTLVIQSQIRANQLQEDYDSIAQQVKNNTLQLTPDMQQLISNDPNLRSLESNLLSLQQQRDVDVKTLGQYYPATRQMDIRIASVQQQIDQTRQRLEVKARLQMEQSAKAAMVAAQAVLADTMHRRDSEQRLVNDLDAALAEYDARAARLKSQQALLSQLTDRAIMLQLRRTTDASRVSEYLPATAPSKMSFPRIPQFLIGGGLIGLALAIGLAYLLELTNTRVRTPRDITGVMRLPMLGFIPDHADDPMLHGNPMTCVRTSPASMTAESFRQVRGRLAAISLGRPLRTVLVASFSPGGGATTVASNLAIGMALSDLRVLLVDMNCYRPALNKIYPNVPSVGIADVLSKKASLEEAIVASAELPNLAIMGAGTRSKLPGEISEHRAFPEVLNELQSRFDMVIFDSAPLTFVSDSINLASKMDGVIAVLRAGMITRGTVGRIRDQLQQVNANFLGIVLNAAQTFSSGYFRQNYRTFFEYAANAPAPQQKLPPGQN